MADPRGGEPERRGPLGASALSARRDLREELAVEVLVELQRNAVAVAVEKDRRNRPPVGSVNHAEMEGHLVALVRRDRALEVPALGLTYDDQPVSVITEQDVGIAGESIREERPVRSVPDIELDRDNEKECGNGP